MTKKKGVARLRIAKIPLVVVKPVVERVITRLDRHEGLLTDIKASLDVQFQRIAALQAQVDHLIAKLGRS